MFTITREWISNHNPLYSVSSTYIKVTVWLIYLRLILKIHNLKRKEYTKLTYFFTEVWMMCRRLFIVEPTLLFYNNCHLANLNGHLANCDSKGFSCEWLSLFQTWVLTWCRHGSWKPAGWVDWTATRLATTFSPKVIAPRCLLGSVG